ncbi:aminoglycoside 3'-phosphotransferase/choline kinase family protein [Amycolatopsis sp. NPDC004079]|uniref:aminoglycoside phosphotransferase family protein n=1 Tax=Amycolatopsis sp. NPDC004079 TaxID=3154549 RepID=UPI0033BE7394
MFPPAATAAESGQLTREGLLPAVRDLLRSLGEPGEPVPFDDGSLPVYAVGDQLVLKLYPPVYLDELTTERTMLEVLHGKLPIPTPGVVHAGTRDGWGYVVMERLPGRTLKQVWPELSTADKLALAPKIGEALSTLHSVRDPALSALAPRDWTAFLAGQREKLVDHHRKTTLDEHWLAQLPEFVDAVDLGTPETVPLHTEVMRDHLLVTREGDDWRLSGLFDFEPAMRGAAEYEFGAVGLFVSGGDPAFLRSLLLAYGYHPADLGPDFSRRCLAYTLLHVYSDFRWYLDVLPAPEKPTFVSLADAWWGA